MANTRISDLTASASNLAASDLVPVVQTPNVGPVKMTGTQIKTGIIGAGSVSIASGKTFTASNTLTLAGTDSTTMTFPSTSATIARTDAGNTFTGNQVITEAVGGSGLTITGATQTTSQPVLNLTQTWNAGAVTFTGLKFNVTNTASSSSSNLIDLQVNTNSAFAVQNIGGGAPTIGLNVANGSGFYGTLLSSGSTKVAYFGATATAGYAFALNSSYFLGFYSSGSFDVNSSPDLRLYRDAANTLALKNSTNPQIFRAYSTTTGPSYGYFASGVTDAGVATADTLFIGTGGAGAAMTKLALVVNGTTRWSLDASGNFLAGADNTYDIGASGTTNRVRTFYSGGGYSAAAPTIKTANYSQGIHDYSLIFNGSGSITLTLLAAATYPGKILYVKTIAAQTVVSASSNVKPIDTDTAGTAILAATAGKWAMLQSDGTNWVIMAQG